jgi:hypothetical protein
LRRNHGRNYVRFRVQVVEWLWVISSSSGINQGLGQLRGGLAMSSGFILLMKELDPLAPGSLLLVLGLRHYLLWIWILILL